MRSRNATSAVALALLIWPSTAATDEPALPSGRTALVVLSSKDSHIREQGLRRISSAKEWRNLWLEHVGDKYDTIHRPSMEIDFEQCMVIAIFGGDTYASWGYRVEEVRENESAVFLRYSNISYQTGYTVGENAEEPAGTHDATPFAFVVLRKSKKLVVVEETTHTMDGKHPTREVARLAPPT